MATTGAYEVKQRGDITVLVVDAVQGIAASKPGDHVWCDEIEYVVIARAGRRYRDLDRHPRCWLADLPVVVAGQPLPVADADRPTTRQLVALDKFGVWRDRARNATRAQASMWLDELTSAASYQRSTGDQTIVDETVRRINHIGE